MIGLSEFQGSGLRCENLIRLQFYLQMLNDNNTYLKCWYQLKQKTVSRETMLKLIKSTFFEKSISSFETLNPTFFLFIIAYILI